MTRLNTTFSEDEKRVLLECAGDDYEILSFIEGESYVLCDKGEFRYNQCFKRTYTRYFARQKYKKVLPYRIIRSDYIYLMNCEEDKSIWYTGRKDENGNWEYTCYSDSLEEAIDSI